MASAPTVGPAISRNGPARLRVNLKAICGEFIAQTVCVEGSAMKARGANVRLISFKYCRIQVAF